MPRKYGILLIILSFFSIKSIAQSNDILIDVNFAGGNVIVEDVNATSTLYYRINDGREVIRLRPDLRDTKGNWFYWYFRVSGAAGRSLQFEFPQMSVGPFGPAVSSDGGASWRWLYSEPDENHQSFTYRFGPDENEVRFSVAIPYLQSNFEEFIGRYQEHSHLEIGKLATTAKGRQVEKLIIGYPDREAAYKVLLTVRHHAVEMMASYALEGIIDAILVSEEPEMVWLRENVEFFMVPFMDKDGVEDGDQGKNRRPRDHVLDYSGESLYASTAALREQIPQWSHGKMKIALDLHCPYLRDTGSGGWNELIYLIGQPDNTINLEVFQFVEILASNIHGELVLGPDHFLPFGEGWNVPEAFIDIGDPFDVWAGTIDGVTLASTIEIPYSINKGQMVTRENLRLFGEDLARAMSVYLKNL